MYGIVVTICFQAVFSHELRLRVTGYRTPLETSSQTQGRHRCGKASRLDDLKKMSANQV